MKLRIIPLGGLGEIGKNMTALEYGDEIIVIDAGIMFPENDMLGIDFIIPDYQYLIDNKEKVKAVIFTHGHEDHVGAVGHLMSVIDAPIYATPLTMGLIEVKLRRAKLAEFVVRHIFRAGETITIGSFKIEPFHVTHSIPDCVGFGITTPVGLIVHTGDYKFDHTPIDQRPPDFAKLAEFSQRGVLCLLADSTNAESPGWTPSERVISAAFDDLFNKAPGRIIVASFASLISRIQQVVDTSYKHGRKVAITGHSMRENTKMAQKLGYLNVPDGVLIDIGQVDSFPDHEVTIMATGSQGEPTAVLGKLARGRHRQLKIKAGDTVVISAHPIPGNEEMINRIINQMFQRGANVMYDRVAQVHVSGHASREEMKLMINLVRPKFFVPVHGDLRHLILHSRLAEEMGIPKSNIRVVENGTVLELDAMSLTVAERIPGGYIFVDGTSVGEIGHTVMQDREELADNGFLVAGVSISKDGELIGAPEIISRGFINFEEADGLLEGLENSIALAAKTYINNTGQLANQIGSAVGRYLHSEVGRRPMVHIILKM